MTSCHANANAAVAAAAARRVAVVGSPNAGKTSVFNQLTGLRAKVGNYPGVTVARNVGTAKVDGRAIAVEDLRSRRGRSAVWRLRRVPGGFQGQ